MKALVRSISIMQAGWQMMLSYRVNATLWRLSGIVYMITTLLVWKFALFSSMDLPGYTWPMMATYLVLGSIIRMMTVNFAERRVARHIRRGKLSQFLVRPYGYIRYLFWNRSGSLSLNYLITMSVSVIPVVFFWSELQWNPSLMVWLIIMGMIILSYGTEFFISVLIGSIAFWMTEVDGIQQSMNRLRVLLAGAFFPLDLLPHWFASLSFALPFAYAQFVPLQLYLGKITVWQGVQGLGVQVAWIVGLYFIVKFVWKKGIKHYEGVGI